MYNWQTTAVKAYIQLFNWQLSVARVSFRFVTSPAPVVLILVEVVLSYGDQFLTQ